MKKVGWSVYIVKCKDSSLYTGISNNVVKRVRKHNNKLGAVSVRGKLPVRLVYTELYKDKIDAAKREREIKSWNRKKKLDLIGVRMGLP
jgi:putative endonuclease